MDRAVLDRGRVAIGALRFALDVDARPVDRLDGVDWEEPSLAIWPQHESLFNEDRLALERNEQSVSGEEGCEASCARWRDDLPVFGNGADSGRVVFMKVELELELPRWCLELEPERLVRRVIAEGELGVEQRERLVSVADLASLAECCDELIRPLDGQGDVRRSLPGRLRKQET